MWIPRFWLGCTNFGVQSCHYLLKMQLLATVQCTVYEDVDVVLWNSISTFYSTCPLFPLSTSMCICLCLHLYITVIYLSISLEVTGSIFLFVLFAVNFSFDVSFLLKPLNFPYLFPISRILLSTLSSLLTWRKIPCFIYTVLYLTSSVTTPNSETTCISNCSLVK